MYVLIAMLLCASLPAKADSLTIDLTDAGTQDVYQWLSAKGFVFEQSANNPRKTRLTAMNNGLTIEALAPSQSILMLKTDNMSDVGNVEITWGVNKFPKGANYDKGRRNEAIMFYAFFGTERIDSGSLLVPDSPYFLALRLCEQEDINVLHLGGYFHAGGRVVCVAHPRPSEIITTTYDLKSAFREAFGKEAPPLTAIGLEFDTTNSGANGTSSAIVTSIRFSPSKR